MLLREKPIACNNSLVSIRATALVVFEKVLISRGQLFRTPTKIFSRSLGTRKLHDAKDFHSHEICFAEHKLLSNFKEADPQMAQPCPTRKTCAWGLGSLDDILSGAPWAHIMRESGD
ncbi:hypothetical protein A5906_09570 [Bradyrhizobium sacchari]|nr:hypothetical protein A5906_09570 [Bradyrhizobium sacchari]